jgi:osmoprotectant transport system permease protein
MIVRGPARNLLAVLGVCVLLGVLAIPLFLKRQAVQTGSKAFAEQPSVQTGSKAFTESVILGEILALLAESRGVNAEHRAGLAGTQIAWRSLVSGEIDAYVEYAGTIRKEILTGRDLPTSEALGQALADRGIHMSRPLGFNNTYAIGMRKDEAARLGIRRISDLRVHPELKFGFTNEFLDRSDGWPGLRARYQLPQTQVTGMEHALAYTSLRSRSIDATDLYSTDAKITIYDLQILNDDRNYFPNYDAVVLYRAELETRVPHVVAAWRNLEGRISETDMQRMNSRVELEKVAERRVAADFLSRVGLLRPEASNDVAVEGAGERMLRAAGQHLALVALSLAAAIVVAVPLGILAAYRPALGQGILAAAGILQTIPSIALLVLLIPLLGSGFKPAIAALFLYSLLPIVRNTYAGLHNIPLSMRESAEALGLPAPARLRLIELPLAARTILAGIKTAAIINVGTATLGGFIGAGGFGQVIFTGLYKDDKALILQGAIPTAVLALAVQGLFELAERLLVPGGLRLRRQE